ncbi:MAG: DUF3631 domain-containing protein [Myxococcota bacterium]
MNDLDRLARRFAQDRALREVGPTFEYEALHRYESEKGELIFWRARFKERASGKKWIRPFFRSGEGLYKMGEPSSSGKNPLYGLPNLLLNTDATIIVVEGEWCADHLVERGLVATTSGGAQSFRRADWSPLRGRRVIVWPDYDDPGADYATHVGEQLNALGCDVLRLDPVRLDLTVGEDCVDWLTRRPALSATQVLNALTEAASPVVRTDKAASPAITSVTSEAAAPAIGEIAEEVSSLVHRHVVCDERTADALALWIVFTWVFEAFDFAPIALITAPEKRCGKSTLLDFIERLAREPLQASNITPAALFRTVEHLRPTLLLDEFDSFVHANEELRGVINSGHKRTGSVVRTVGPQHEPKHFSTWCPKAMAGIGRPPDTIVDRAIVFRLKRKRPGQTVQRLRQSETEFAALREQLSLLPAHHADQLEHTHVEPPPYLNDREADNWDPLLAIASIAGGSWPERATTAARALSGVDEEDPGLGVELLRDIAEIFKRLGDEADRISSAELVRHLLEDRELRWATLENGRPLTQNRLANLLRGFEIRSTSIRIGNATPKGYYRRGFDESFERYLPATPQHHR